ncbi:MAG: OmpH family outer membrane protein [Nitrospira sp.]|nr:OmpH family outer membrane protein [Nitrospira sp.]
MNRGWVERAGGWTAGAMLAAALLMSGCSSSWLKVERRIDGRIGVVDAQRVFERTNAGKKAKDNLLSFSKSRQALMELEEKELRRMEEDLVKQSTVLSPAARREREEQFRRRLQDYQQKAAELNREVQEKQKDVLEAFRDKVELVAGKVGKRLGLQIVVDKSKGGPTLYHDDTIDISGLVIEEFNRDYP